VLEKMVWRAAAAKAAAAKLRDGRYCAGGPGGHE
jgi:hypothetical protein